MTAVSNLPRRPQRGISGQATDPCPVLLCPWAQLRDLTKQVLLKPSSGLVIPLLKHPPWLPRAHSNT